MLCTSQFLHDRLCITRQDMTIPCRSPTLQESSVILYLLVLLCICKGYIKSATCTAKCDYWRMFRMLRQEFHDLELSDKITKLAFYSQPPPEINGHSRNTLIRQFRVWKG